MKTVIVALVLLAAGGLARAEEARPRSMVGVSASLWFPMADADDLADASMGVRPAFTFWITPMIGVVASFDWVFVSEQSYVPDTRYYAISAGGRVTTPKPAFARPFGELLIGRHTIDNDEIGAESDLGFRAGGGALLSFGPHVGGVVEVSYSSAEIESGTLNVDLEIEAFVVEAALAGQF